MRKFYSEAAYLAGIGGLALGTALIAKAGFGVSMVVAPAYILHLKVSEYLSFFTFGTAQYTLQAALLVVTCLVLRRFRVSYLFSFVTAVFYGLLLDLFSLPVSLLPEFMPLRIAEFAVGMLFCTSGVAFVFHTYVSPEVYELFVKEFSKSFGYNIDKVKIAYDLSSFACSVLMSFIFFGFGKFRGIGVGTAVTAVLNGALIAVFSRIFERKFEFVDRFSFRAFFESE